MYVTVKRFIRPSTDILFFHELPPNDWVGKFNNYYKKTYIDSNKLISNKREYSEDRLICIQTTQYSTRENLLEIQVDDIVAGYTRKLYMYNINNNIIMKIIDAYEI